VSKITRYNGNLKAFASEATGTERTIFGDTAQSDTLDANITLDLLRGWGVIGVESNPTKQHFNGLAFTLGQLIAYLHQQGVPEWNAAQEYYAGSVVTTLAGIYRLKSGGVGSSDPDTDGGINWELIPTQAKVDDKADKATTYTETEVDGLLDEKADQANTYTETEVDELTGSLAYPNTTLASSSDISESVEPAIAAYPHIQGFRTGTGTALTFAQAVEEAAERGARLLTIQELEAGVAANAGFKYNFEITWTSSPAGVGLVYGNIGQGTGTRVILNTSTDTAAGGYAVSVIGQRQWADTQYADKATTYTETEVDNLLDDKANISGQAFSGNISAPNLSGTNTGDQTKADIDALNIDANTLDGLDSLDFVRDNGDSGMSGDYSTTGNVESGRESGGVALTINDSQGNANVTFNHANGEAEQAGNSGRITLNTDSITGALMGFEVLDNDSSGPVTTISIMNITENGVEVTQGSISAPNLSGTNTGDGVLAIGVGQTWQDVTGSRSDGVTYTNSTGKPIMVSIILDGSGSRNSSAITVDSVGVGAEREGGLLPNQFIVPNGSVYRVNDSAILAWTELR
jgi:hypothetical protein